MGGCLLFLLFSGLIVLRNGWLFDILRLILAVSTWPGSAVVVRFSIRS